MASSDQVVPERDDCGDHRPEPGPLARRGAIALDGSRPRRVAFHAASVRVRDATHLGMALMSSM
jgi:hypothetical protein